LEVNRLGHAHWQSLHEWGQSRKFFNPTEAGVIATAARPGVVPTDKQSLVAMAANTKAIEAGFQGTDR
jgi:hypothetical protein